MFVIGDKDNIPLICVLYKKRDGSFSIHTQSDGSALSDAGTFPKVCGNYTCQQLADSAKNVLTRLESLVLP